MRKVNIAKSSNIKCEHCEHYNGREVGKCKITDEKKYYYNRCKSFDWCRRIKDQDAEDKENGK